MAHVELHRRLQEVLPAAVLAGAPGVAGAGDEVASLEAHATSGCSLCARALVNARDALLDLAVAAAPREPTAKLRERVLADLPRRAPAPEGRVLDSSAAVAHAHIGAPGDAERTAEIDRVRAWDPREGDGLDALLAELGRVVAFPILFVSIVRGERVGYRAQRGLPPELAVHRDMRRETTFCTHCVAGDQPLVVRDAAREAFFRGSKMVQRFGVRAYVGVPLRTSRAITVGTVCALDAMPREIGEPHVRALEGFGPRIAAIIEQP